jgi:hypothetical protein
MPSEAPHRPSSAGIRLLHKRSWLQTESLPNKGLCGVGKRVTVHSGIAMAADGELLAHGREPRISPWACLGQGVDPAPFSTRDCAGGAGSYHSLTPRVQSTQAKITGAGSNSCPASLVRSLDQVLRDFVAAGRFVGRIDCSSSSPLSDGCDQHVKNSGNLSSDGTAMAVSNGIQRNQEELRCASIQPE